VSDKQVELVQRLQALEGIRGYSDDEWSEPEALAHAIISTVVIGEKLSRMSKALLNCSSEAEFPDQLHELREELGHLAYHIFDSRYFRIVAKRFIADAEG